MPLGLRFQDSLNQLKPLEKCWCEVCLSSILPILDRSQSATTYSSKPAALKKVQKAIKLGCLCRCEAASLSGCRYCCSGNCSGLVQQAFSCPKCHTHFDVAMAAKSKSRPKKVPVWAKLCFFSVAKGVPSSSLSVAKAHCAQGPEDTQSVMWASSKYMLTNMRKNLRPMASTNFEYWLKLVTAKGNPNKRELYIWNAGACHS